MPIIQPLHSFFLFAVFISVCCCSYICEQGKDGCRECSSISQCNRCLRGWFPINFQCLKCIDGCSYCNNNVSCTTCYEDFEKDNIDNLCKCRKGRYFDSQREACLACEVENCENCANNICEECYVGFTLMSSNNTCQRCNDEKCLICEKDNPHKCILCSYLFILENGVCLDKNDCNRSACAHSSEKECFQCLSNYTYPRSSCISCGSCSNNAISENCNLDCIKCLFNADESSSSFACVDGFGKVEYKFKTNPPCIACKQSECISCHTNYSECTKCKYGFELLDKECVACSMANCSICGAKNDCDLCDIGFYESYHKTCLPCPVNCSMCDNSGVCLLCHPKFGLSFSDPNWKCEACHSLCLTCYLANNYNSCYSCLSNYYLDGSYCKKCSANCLKCYQNISSPHNESCEECEEDYLLKETTLVCIEKCTYGATSYNCTLPLGVDWDGCDDFCQVEPGFECSTIDICSYKEHIILEIVKLWRDPIGNTIKMNVKVEPPLNVFNNQNELMTVFNISVGLKISSISFDPVNSFMTFICEIEQDIGPIPNISIKFNPTLSSDRRYKLSPEDLFTFNQVVFPAHRPYYYTEFSLLIFKLIPYFSYVSAAFSWIALILGLVFRKLAGLEAMGVLQYGFFSMFWLNSYLHPHFEQTFPLKYSTGYNFPFFDEPAAEFLYSAPYTTQFSISRMFCNSFNIMLSLQLVPIIVSLFFWVRLKLCFKKVDKNDLYRDKEIEKEEKRLSNYFELSQQVMLYFTTFNLISLTALSIIFFRNLSEATTNSIALLASSYLLTSFALLRFFFDPDPFGFFRYSFRYTLKSCIFELSFKHHLLYEMLVVASFVISVLFVSMPYLPLIILFSLLIHTIVYHPYKERRENYRSAFNILTMCSIVGLSVLLKYHSLPLHNSDILNALMIVIFCLLIPMCPIIAIIFMIYGYIYVNYIKPKEDLVNEDYIEMKNKANVYEMLDKINVSQKLMEIRNHENVFMKIGKPSKNLFELSHILHEEIETDKLFFDSSKGKVRENVENESAVKESEVSLSEKINQNKKQKIDTSSFSKRVLSKNEKFAKEILGEEDVYLNLKYKNELYEELGHSKHEMDYTKAYNAIEGKAKCRLEMTEKPSIEENDLKEAL